MGLCEGIWVYLCGNMWLCGKKLGASRVLFVGQLLSQMKRMHCLRKCEVSVCGVSVCGVSVCGVSVCSDSVWWQCGVSV